jgi:hypothetical protein
MNCGDFDPKDLALGEIAGAARQEAEAHVAGCEACKAKAEAARLTVSALRLSADHEIPRRIAFVSDPVFEPSWWQRFWRSGPQAGFASAVIVAGAIVAHGFLAPDAAAGPAAASAAVERRVSDEVARRLPEAVDAAVDARVKAVLAELEQRIDSMDRTRMASLERKFDSERRGEMKNLESAFNIIERRLAVIQASAARYGGDD